MFLLFHAPLRGGVNIARNTGVKFAGIYTIAFVIATPVAWWAMHRWLEAFVYKVTIAWWMFALAGLSAIIIALFTVSFQAIKAAVVNPVKGLRSE